MPSKKKTEDELKENIKDLIEQVTKLTRAWQREPSSKLGNEIVCTIDRYKVEINDCREQLRAIASGSKSPSGIDDLHSDQDDDEAEKENTWRNSP